MTYVHILCIILVSESTIYVEIRGDVLDNNEKQKKNIIEAGIVIFVMTLYIVYGIQFLPLLIILVPIPFIVLGVRNGFSWNVLSIAITLLVVELFLGDTIGASLVIIFAPLSMGINYCIHKRKNPRQTIFISTLFFLIPLLITLLFGIKIGNVDVITEIDTVFTEYISIQTEVLKEIGSTNENILEKAKQWEEDYKTFKMVIPSLIIVFSTFITYVNYFFTGIVLRQMEYGLIKRPRLSRFKLPKDAILGIGVMILTGFILKWINFQNNQALLLNILFLSSVMFMIQGLAVLDFFLKKIGIKLIFRVILIVLNMIVLPIGSIIIFVGLLDSVFNIRKLKS